jgi:molybdenum cofactor cytidylyltransferase
MTTEDLPIVSPGALPPADEVGGGKERGPEEPRVVGVLLAAGTSSRFGAANKLLADLEGEALVRHGARALLDSAVGRVLVVVGHEAGAVRDALDGLDVEFVGNPDFADGQSASVRAGAAAAATTDADAAVFLPGDMPFVAAAAVDALRRAYLAGAGTALAAAHEGRRGNPVLFDRRHFEALRDVTGDVGGRAVLLGSDRAALVETGDPGVRIDVDTRADLRQHR